MQSKIQVRRIQILVSALVVAMMALAGCGSSPTPTEAVDTSLTGTGTNTSTSTTNLYSSPIVDATASSTESATPTPFPTVPPTLDPTATPAPTPVPTATPTPAPTPVALPAEYALSAVVVDSTSSGFLIWQKLTANVELSNPSFLFQQTGTVVVSFSYQGKVVETLQQLVTLNPAEIQDIAFQSSQRADTVSVAIATN